MTPQEKLTKIKDILFKVEKEGEHIIDYDAAGNLEGVLQDMRHFLSENYKDHIGEDDPIFTTIHRVRDQIYQVLDILNEPEVNPGDRFPHITHHEEHQHDDKDGW